MAALTPGTRVAVKFKDDSKSGFSWYNGTIRGPKGPKKYRVDYDDDDEVTSLDPQDEEYQLLPPTKEGSPPEPPDDVENRDGKDRGSRLKALLARLPADKSAVAVQERWCDAKVLAWLERERNPNAYLYRFLPEGEQPKNGPWAPEEMAELKRICLEKGVNLAGSRPKWGLISRHFPGRVGYACSAMYRKFVDRKEIEDPNYTFEDGKSKYRRQREAPPPGGSDNPPRSRRTSTGARSATHRRKRRRRGDRDAVHASDVSTDEEGEWDLSTKHFTDSRTVDWVTDEAQSSAALNPLPNFLDPITGDIVRQPCISPEGYVAGRRAWLAALERRGGKCPFTNVKLSHRALTALNFDNIDEYRHRIRNVEGDPAVALSCEPLSGGPADEGSPTAVAPDLPPAGPAPDQALPDP